MESDTSRYKFIVPIFGSSTDQQLSIYFYPLFGLFSDLKRNFLQNSLIFEIMTSKLFQNEIK